MRNVTFRAALVSGMLLAISGAATAATPEHALPSSQASRSTRPPIQQADSAVREQCPGVPVGRGADLGG